LSSKAYSGKETDNDKPNHAEFLKERTLQILKMLNQRDQSKFKEPARQDMSKKQYKSPFKPF